MTIFKSIFYKNNSNLQHLWWGCKISKRRKSTIHDTCFMISHMCDLKNSKKKQSQHRAWSGEIGSDASLVNYWDHLSKDLGACPISGTWGGWDTGWGFSSIFPLALVTFYPNQQCKHCQNIIWKKKETKSKDSYQGMEMQVGEMGRCWSKPL